MAILAPAADIWAQKGLVRQPFHVEPWYAHQLWKAVQQSGCGADFVSEAVLREARVVDGQVACGEMRYQALILASARSLEPETAAAVRRLTEAGARVVLAGEIPSRSPGYLNADEKDELVRTAMRGILDRGRVMHRAAPGDGEILAWTDSLLSELGIVRPARETAPAGVYQVNYRHGKRRLFFFANYEASGTAVFDAAFGGVDGLVPHRWDPETGTRAPYVFGSAPDRLAIRLEPHQSLLLVFEPGDPVPMRPLPAEPPALLTLAGPWKALFQPAFGKAFAIEALDLQDLGASVDSRLNTFSGVATYQTRFTVAQDLPEVLDLGRVEGVSEVMLNGRPVGTQWYGRRHVFDLSRAVRAGENELQVRVTTTLFNHTRTLTDNPAAMSWVQAGLRAGFPATEPAGLIGPVVLK